MNSSAFRGQAAGTDDVRCPDLLHLAGVEPPEWNRYQGRLLLSRTYARGCRGYYPHDGMWEYPDLNSGSEIVWKTQRSGGNEEQNKIEHMIGICLMRH